MSMRDVFFFECYTHIVGRYFVSLSREVTSMH